MSASDNITITPLPDEVIDNYLRELVPLPETCPGTGGDPVQTSVIYSAALRYGRDLIRQAEAQGLIPAPNVLYALARDDRRRRPDKIAHFARVLVLRAAESVTVGAA